MSKAEISRIDRRSLSECEAVIRRGMGTFIEVGSALREIRDGRLYKPDFPTFERYCRKRWGWTRRYADYQISAAVTAEKVRTIVPKLAVTENLLRPIVNLTQDQQTRVWQQAVETAPEGKLTAKHVAKVAAQFKEPASGKAPSPKEWDLAEAWVKLEEDLKRHQAAWPWEHRKEFIRILTEFADYATDLRKEFWA